VTLAAPAGGAQAAALARHPELLPELFIVSQVRVEPPTGTELSVAVQPCGEQALSRCPRCWRWVATVGGDPAHPTCPRCAEALAHGPA